MAHPLELRSVDALYEEWVRCWRELDGMAMVDLFSDQPEGFVYQAEEFPKPFLDKEKLRRYWTSVPRDVIERIEEWEEVSKVVLPLDASTVMLYVLTNTTLRLRGMGAAISGILRSTLVIHTAPSGEARIVHYHESRLLKLGLTVG
jgi:hypothetical protein